MDEWEQGFLLGLLVGEGHFGGDGRQPQVTLRMHSRHEALFRWLLDRVPGSRLYGPYHHGNRSYFQWMVRGEPLRLLSKLLESRPWTNIAPPVEQRYQEMKEKYRAFFREEGGAPAE